MMVVMMEGTSSDIRVLVHGDDGSSKEANDKSEWISLFVVSTIVFATVPHIIFRFSVFCIPQMCSLKYTTAPQMNCNYLSGTFLQFLIPLLEITL